MIIAKLRHNPYLKWLKFFLKKNVFIEFRFYLIPKFLKDPNCKILDIGCGNYSLQRAKLQYPKSKYYGLDLQRRFYSLKEIRMMEKFFEIDLNTLDYSEIPYNFFDIIILSHVLEHLPEGRKVLIQLISKLKKNGLIYIEYPSIRSTKLPHRKGTLNFFDDPSHISLYSNEEFRFILMRSGFKILKEGIRRDFRKIIFLPFLIIYDLFKYRLIKTGHLWDLFGFADYLIAVKLVPSHVK